MFGRKGLTPREKIFLRYIVPHCRAEESGEWLVNELLDLTATSDEIRHVFDEIQRTHVGDNPTKIHVVPGLVILAVFMATIYVLRFPVIGLFDVNALNNRFAKRFIAFIFAVPAVGFSMGAFFLLKSFGIRVTEPEKIVYVDREETVQKLHEHARES